ncbi:MAG: hypothetical protein WA825_08185 [Steroidobacteraceae bacterium]
MNLYVLAADIRKRGVIAVEFGLEDQGALASMAPLSKEAGPEVQAKLQRHVETWHAGGGVDLNSRQVVNTPVTLSYHLGDLADANLCAIGRVQGAPRIIAR